MPVSRLSRKPIRIPAAVLFTKTSPAIRSREFREVERQLASRNTPMFDTRLHMRDAFAAIFSRGVPLHALEPDSIHKLDAAIQNADAFVRETVKMLEQARSEPAREVA